VPEHPSLYGPLQCSQTTDPWHLLISRPLDSIREITFLEVEPNLLKRWQLVQRVVQHFWKRWSSEYLSRLQQRPKWCSTWNKIQEGDVILVEDEHLPPLGSTAAVHPGNRGLWEEWLWNLTEMILRDPLWRCFSCHSVTRICTRSPTHLMKMLNFFLVFIAWGFNFKIIYFGCYGEYGAVCTFVSRARQCVCLCKQHASELAVIGRGYCVSSSSVQMIFTSWACNGWYNNSRRVLVNERHPPVTRVHLFTGQQLIQLHFTLLTSVQFD
jgi:hypothetical protein